MEKLNKLNINDNKKTFKKLCINDLEKLLCFNEREEILTDEVYDAIITELKNRREKKTNLSEYLGRCFKEKNSFLLKVLYRVNSIDEERETLLCDVLYISDNNDYGDKEFSITTNQATMPFIKNGCLNEEFYEEININYFTEICNMLNNMFKTVNSFLDKKTNTCYDEK